MQMPANTLEIKNAYETFWRQHGHEVHHYNHDTGHSADNMFLSDVSMENANHQNGLAEKAIWDLQEQARMTS